MQEANKLHISVKFEQDNFIDLDEVLILYSRLYIVLIHFFLNSFT